MIEINSVTDVLIPVGVVAFFAFTLIGWSANRNPGMTEKEIAESRRTSFFMKVFALIDVFILIVLLVIRFLLNLW